MTAAPSESTPSYEELLAAKRKSEWQASGRKTVIKWTIGGLLVGLAIATAVTVWRHSYVGIFAVLPLFCVLVAALTGWTLFRAKTSDEATEEFFTAFANARGWQYTASPPVYRDTPSLADGDEQFGANGFTGLLCGLPGTIYEHTRRVRQTVTTTDGKGHTTTTTENIDTAFVVLHYELPLPGLNRLYLHPRAWGHLFDGVESKLSRNQVVELESIDFNDAYKVTVDDAADQTAVRQLFSPRAQQDLLAFKPGEHHGLFSNEASHPFAEGLTLECEAGALVFLCEGSIYPQYPGYVDEFIAMAAPYVAWLSAYAKSGPAA
jgi:hypothetical protein